MQSRLGKGVQMNESLLVFKSRFHAIVCALREMFINLKAQEEVSELQKKSPFKISDLNFEIARNFRYRRLCYLR